MAKTPTKKAPAKSGPHGSIKATELKKMVREFTRLEKIEQESVGEAKTYLGKRIKAHHLHEKALGAAMKVHKMEGQPRDAYVRSFLEYCTKLGVFDQLDAFDDTLKYLREVLDGAEKRQTKTGVKKDAFAGADPAKPPSDVKSPAEVGVGEHGGTSPSGAPLN